MAVEKLIDGEWVQVADDHDYSTKFIWKRHLAAQSKVALEWDIPADAGVGTYCFKYFGVAKDGAGKLTDFTGVSDSFDVKAS